MSCSHTHCVSCKEHHEGKLKQNSKVPGVKLCFSLKGCVCVSVSISQSQRETWQDSQLHIELALNAASRGEFTHTACFGSSAMSYFKHFHKSLSAVAEAATQCFLSSFQQGPKRIHGTQTHPKQLRQPSCYALRKKDLG